MSENKMIIDNFAGEYRFLSNFWKCPIYFEGEVYPSVEHAYQAAKTRNMAEREIIRSKSSPGEAKKSGRGVTIRSNWNDIKINTMRGLLITKFEWPGERDLLLKTGNAKLIEGNWWGDIFWGVCKGVGENHLGKLLMEIREPLFSKTGGGNTMTKNTDNKEHHWSGWPGAICLHCGSGDPIEQALADNEVDFGPHLGPGVMEYQSKDIEDRIKKDNICLVGYSDKCGQCK